MARPRTAAENRAFWLARAEEYKREATKCKSHEAIRYWHEKAAAARSHALTYKD